MFGGYNYGWEHAAEEKREHFTVFTVYWSFKLSYILVEEKRVMAALLPPRNSRRHSRHRGDGGGGDGCGGKLVRLGFLLNEQKEC